MYVKLVIQEPYQFALLLPISSQPVWGSIPLVIWFASVQGQVTVLRGCCPYCKGCAHLQG